MLFRFPQSFPNKKKTGSVPRWWKINPRGQKNEIKNSYDILAKLHPNSPRPGEVGFETSITWFLGYGPRWAPQCQPPADPHSSGIVRPGVAPRRESSKTSDGQPTVIASFLEVLVITFEGTSLSSLRSWFCSVLIQLLVMAIEWNSQANLPINQRHLIYER
jgi:hypothetical protein